MCFAGVNVVKAREGTDNREDNVIEEVQAKSVARYERDINARWSVEEVARHNSDHSCWLIAHGKVFDPTEYLESHPGGLCILKRGGQDATRDFEFHSRKARNRWSDYCIGMLDTEPTTICGKVLKYFSGR